MKFNFFLLFFFSISISAEVTLTPTIERSGGEYIFETGNRFPNLSGIQGGSRISFPRDMTLFGVRLNLAKDRWEANIAYKTTGWYQKSGEAKDEDFFLGSISTEKGTNIATREWSYRDSATVYSGSRNFAEGKGKSTLFEQRFEAFGRYYFRQETETNPREGFFLSSGIRYSYFKHIFYDVNQFIASNPVVYSPIGLGLTLSNDLYEIFYGFGYKMKADQISFELTFMPSIGLIRTRDFHVQRSINFFSENYGTGWISNISAFYHLNSENSFFLSLNHRRFFSEGSFKSRGGLTEADLRSNLVSGFKSHINIKDYTIQFGFNRIIEWEPKNVNDSDENNQ